MTGTTSAYSGPHVSTDLADRETSCPAQLHHGLAGGRVLLGLRRVGLVATPPHAAKSSAPKGNDHRRSRPMAMVGPRLLATPPHATKNSAPRVAG